jgi:hypothetical protein
MGVQLYLLDRRLVTLLIGGVEEEIATLRQFWKVTEIDSARAAEIEAVKTSLRGKPAPFAAMIAGASEMPLASKPSRNIAVHLILGWDEDRASVTDLAWDYLPILGYAVKTADSTGYVLHEERDGLLHPISEGRAMELGILDASGRLIRTGQPSIIECKSVRPYIANYAEADCLLSDGRMVEILTSVEAGVLPTPGWYAGKRPSDVTKFTPVEPSETNHDIIP